MGQTSPLEPSDSCRLVHPKRTGATTIRIHGAAAVVGGDVTVVPDGVRSTNVKAMKPTRRATYEVYDNADGTRTAVNSAPVARDAVAVILGCHGIYSNGWD
jgi:hypothetical protein